MGHARAEQDGRSWERGRRGRHTRGRAGQKTSNRSRTISYLQVWGICCHHAITLGIETRANPIAPLARHTPNPCGKEPTRTTPLRVGPFPTHLTAAAVTSQRWGACAQDGGKRGAELMERVLVRWSHLRATTSVHVPVARHSWTTPVHDIRSRAAATICFRDFRVIVCRVHLDIARRVECRCGETRERSVRVTVKTSTTTTSPKSKSCLISILLLSLFITPVSLMVSVTASYQIAPCSRLNVAFFSFFFSLFY